MRTIGCLAVIVLVGIGIFLLTSSWDMDGEQKAQWVGEKAHRGWNRMKKAAEAAEQGWKSVKDENTGQQGSQ